MNRPLTRTPAPALDFSRPGTPAASDFGDIYFSTDGGLDEARAVFLHGCGLPDAWDRRDLFTIAELGFGSGLNFLAAWQAWTQSGASGRLHVISVERFPFARDDLARALSAFPELADLTAPLIRQWPGPVRGVHRLHFGNVALTLIHDDVAPALANQSFRADAWFLDGFSPAKNPDMWSAAIMAEVARLSAPGARLATFTVAGAVRRALTEAGFDVERKDGFGRKRHRLQARLLDAAASDPAQAGTQPYKPTQKPRQKPPLPTIIGHGIAGASVARAFARRGLRPTVLFDPDHPLASGNAAALIKPRLDLQDRPESRFFLSSYLYALRAYRDAVLHEGVTHLPKDARDAERMARIAGNDPLPGHLRWEDDRMEMDRALVIDPEAARAQFLDGADVRAQRVADPSAIDGPIILAGGYGIRTLLPDVSFRFARGQLSWACGALERPVTYGGYAMSVGERVLLGATHDRIEDHAAATDLHAADDMRNLESATARGLAVDGVTPHRASVRVNSPDTLPRLSQITHAKTGQEMHILSGLGSRGFVFAPLLGEALVSQYLGEPSPLTDPVRARFSRLPD